MCNRERERERERVGESHVLLAYAQPTQIVFSTTTDYYLLLLLLLFVETLGIDTRPHCPPNHHRVGSSSSIRDDSTCASHATYYY